MLASILFGGSVPIAVAYSLGSFCLKGLRPPRTIALAVGAAIESTIVFLLLLAGRANWIAFAAMGVIALLLFFWRGTDQGRAVITRDRPIVVLTVILLACYGFLYLIHTLAPEIQSDASGYHLGLVAEYHRIHKFPKRIGFYEMFPQGLEMLFLVAFSFGRHSAAKLVHFAFLIATVPLILQVGRRLHLRDAVSVTAALLYFCAPVVGVDGTCAYNDAALVFFVLATFYLLLVWKQGGDDRYVIPAGVTAGFCCAVKLSGAVALPLGLAFLLSARRKKPILMFAALTFALALPWLLRNEVLTGNPLAPFFNRWFPNPYFPLTVEQEISQNRRFYNIAPWTRVPWELTVGGAFQGVLGPLFLLLPLAFTALRTRAGRLILATAMLLAAPWLLNSGTRFLMPALPFLALALAIALPRNLALACIVFHAVTCWPQVIERYQPQPMWRLQEVPWRAALRIEPEEIYLRRALSDFQVAQLVNTEVPRSGRVFAMTTIPKAYTRAEVLEFWHSTKAEQLGDALRAGGEPGLLLYDWTASWNAQPLQAVRFRLPARHPFGEWDVVEVALQSGSDRIEKSVSWTLDAWPNVWEAPLAFDDNLASRWRSREPMLAGMYLQVNFDHARLLSGANLVSHTPIYDVPLEVWGLTTDGHWRLVSDAAAYLRKSPDLRFPAVRKVRAAGFSYILAPVGTHGLGPLGADMTEHPKEWGLEPVGEVGAVHLLRIRE